MYDKPLVRIGLEAAKLPREFLLKNSKDALEKMDKKEVSEAFKNCVDTIFPISACVGSFAVQYGRTAGAHAIHNRLILIKETHSVLQGTKASYGILVQLVAQGKIEEAKELVKFYRENNLTYNLSCVNITEDVENKIKIIANFAVSLEETFVLAIDNCTPEVVVEAMKRVETL